MLVDRTVDSHLGLQSAGRSSLSDPTRVHLTPGPGPASGPQTPPLPQVHLQKEEGPALPPPTCSFPRAPQVPGCC